MSNHPNHTVAHSFFVHHPLGVLSTLGESGDIETASIYFAIDDKYNCYFVTKDSTRKYKNIIDRRQATLTVFEENILMFGEVRGRAEAVDNTDEAVAKMTLLQDTIASRKAEYWVPPVSQIQTGNFLVMKLVPESVTFINYSTSETAEHIDPVKIVLSKEDFESDG